MDGCAWPLKWSTGTLTAEQVQREPSAQSAGFDPGPATEAANAIPTTMTTMTASAIQRPGSCRRLAATGEDGAPPRANGAAGHGATTGGGGGSRTGGGGGCGQASSSGIDPSVIRLPPDQCPSACSFLCASTIFSARWDGTSS